MSSTYSLSVFCPQCGRNETGVMEVQTINCTACGAVITSWDFDQPDFEDEDIDEE
jgi:uncharacterized Zn finger protein